MKSMKKMDMWELLLEVGEMMDLEKESTKADQKAYCVKRQDRLARELAKKYKIGPSVHI